MLVLTPLEIEVLYDTYRLHQLACGTLALLSFDILLNLKAEVAYVWRRPLSLFKTLYVICRYGPMVIPCLLLGFPSDTPRLLGNGMVFTLRDHNAVYIPIGLFACHTTGQVIYIEVVVLILLLTSEAVAYISVVSFNVASTQSTVMTIPSLNFKFCKLIAHLSPGAQISPGIPFLIIAVLYFAFAASAFYGHLRQRVTLTKHRFLRESGTLAPVLTVLFRDGIVCYLSNFGCVSLFAQYYLISFWLLLVNSAVGLALYGVYGHSMLFSVASLVIAANSSIISSRLVLVLKGDASYATGIYRAGTELQIVNQDDHDHDEDSQLDEIADFQVERTRSPYFGQELEGILSVPLDVL